MSRRSSHRGALAGAPTVALLLLCGTVAASCQANDTFVDPPAAQQQWCVPNLDGAIDAHEVPMGAAAGARFRVSARKSKATVSTAGGDGGDGQRAWSWDAQTPEDDVVPAGEVPLQGAWFADAFPDAELALPLDRERSLVGLYRRDAQAFWLLGFASIAAEPAAKRTLARYDPAVPLLRWPLQAGREWTAAAKLSGATVQGLPYAGEHRYHVRVAAAGELRLPDVIFRPALQVRTAMTNTPLVGAAVTTRQVSFFFECFGEVARLKADGPENSEGNSTGELWRYHP